jgi:hypothetical protein
MTYQLFGFEMKTKVFNKPFLAKDIFDFWNRFLAQTKEYILRLFLMPIEKYLRHFIADTKIRFAISLALTFLFIDIVIHITAMYDMQTLRSAGAFIGEWYFVLMAFFAIYWAGRTFIPQPIQRLGQRSLGRVVKTAFWVSLILYFY